MSFVNSATIRSQVGQAPNAFAITIDNLLQGLGDISLVSADLTAPVDENHSFYEFTVQYRIGGLAAYRADAFTFDTDAGVTFDAQVNAYFANALISPTHFPRMYFDMTPKNTARITQAVLVISEEVEASGDGSYAVGDQEFLTKHPHFGTAQANIAADASGTIRLYSSGGRYLDITATNVGPITIPQDERALVIFDHITQVAWAYPSCCDAP